MKSLLIFCAFYGRFAVFHAWENHLIFIFFYFTVLFNQILGDVRFLWPRATADHERQLFDEFTIITRKDVYENDENRIDLITLMLRSVDNSDQNEIKPYFYDRPTIPFDDGAIPSSSSPSLQDVDVIVPNSNAEPTTERPSDGDSTIPLPEKLEIFTGYTYDRPSNSMQLPSEEVPNESTTTDTVDYLPGASSRTTVDVEEDESSFSAQ